MPITSITDTLDEINSRAKSIIAIGDLLSSLSDPSLREETLPRIGLLLIWIVEDLQDCLRKTQDDLLIGGEKS